MTLNHKAPVAALIMLGMIITMMFDFIPVAPVTAVIVAALLMVLTGCFRNVEEAYKTINWESIVLIAGMLPMSLALENRGFGSGVAIIGERSGYLRAFCFVGRHLFHYFADDDVYQQYGYCGAACSIALHSAVQLGLSPYPFLFAVTVAASMCFASPFSTPPNALVMPAGRYTFMDYVKVGLPLQIIMGVVMVFVLPLLFPF